MNSKKIEIEILKDPEEIYENLYFGKNLPVTDNLKYYIINEIKALNIKSLLLKNAQKTVMGHVILYHFEGIQYFGFFNAEDGKHEYIDVLISEIIEEAKKNECNSIRGPMNPPPTIYGWGFAEEGSDSSIYATAPYNENDITYIQAFLNKGFKYWHRILHYRHPLHEFSRRSEWKISNADFSHPEQWLKEFFELQMREFPESAQITPNRGAVVDDYLKLVQQFGREEQVQFIRDPNNGGKIVGLLYATPNPFDLDENGKSKTVIINGGAIDKDYQNKHMIMMILSSLTSALVDEGMNTAESIMADDNIRSIKGAEGAGGKGVRSHVVLELKI